MFFHLKHTNPYYTTSLPAVQQRQVSEEEEVLQIRHMADKQQWQLKNPLNVQNPLLSHSRMTLRMFGATETCFLSTFRKTPNLISGQEFSYYRSVYTEEFPK